VTRRVVQEFEAVVCSTDAYLLGEGCRWDEVRGELSWVSVYDGQFLCGRAAGPEIDIIRRYDLGGHVGAFAPYVERGEGWIVARDQSLVHLRESGEVELLAEPEARNAPSVRVNDGAADPWGRYWIGSMAYDEAPGRGSLYRYDTARGVETILSGVTISNGIGWSLDRRTMYYVDSGPATVFAFDVDDAGDISNRRVFAQLDAATEGSPDGLCVDAEGGVWVALWGGWSVRRYSPGGEVIGEARVGTSQASCCAIGGAGATTLYVTTAREGYSDEQLARDPMAGRIWCVDVGVTGVPLSAFRP
jgi:sugar lactone lactonase YvrE